MTDYHIIVFLAFTFGFISGISIYALAIAIKFTWHNRRARNQFVKYINLNKDY